MIFNTVRSSSNLVTPDIKSILRYLKVSYDSGCLAHSGPATKELEKRLGEVHDVDHCITFPNCFSSIICSFLCYPLEKGMEVVTPSFAYRRFGDIIAWLGLIPHYCEVDSESMTPTLEMVESCINENTAAILLVQPMVRVVDFEPFMPLARKYNIPLIIDSVEAPYSTCNGKTIGTFGDVECFSMHASKLINACDGGYATTNDPFFAERLRKMRTKLGMELNELNAVVALASLEGIEDQIVKNKERYNLYKKLLENIRGIKLVEYSENEPRSFKNILVEIENSWPISREETLKLLQSENILARPFWSPPLHKAKTAYKKIVGGLPITEEESAKYMLLPCGEFVSLEDIEKICGFLNTLSMSIVPEWDDLEKCFRDIVERRWYTSSGPVLRELEGKLAEFFNVKHAIGVVNESHALMISYNSARTNKVFLTTPLSANLSYALDITKEVDEKIAFDVCKDGVAIGVYTVDEWRAVKDFHSRFLVIISSIGVTSGSFILTNDDYLADCVRNTRSVPGILKHVDVYATGNGRMSEPQAAVISLELERRKRGSL